MQVDLHNHTPLCNHATGSIDEYIQAAIAKGISYFGFSDHAPMDFDPHYRMSFDAMADYEADVKDAKKRYADAITILLGYEVDFLPGHMDKRVLDAEVDYLIGSVHFLQGWGFDNPEFLAKWKEQDVNDVWKNYFETITQMVHSGYFDIVGHLDLIKVFNFLPTLSITDLAQEALHAIKEKEMVLEINGAGLRKPVAQPYPSFELLKEAKRLNIAITLSSDAHEPSQVGLFASEITKMAYEAGYRECAYFIKKERYMTAL